VATNEVTPTRRPNKADFKHKRPINILYSVLQYSLHLQQVNFENGINRAPEVAPIITKYSQARQSIIGGKAIY
jgi:hypothetical protein